MLIVASPGRHFMLMTRFAVFGLVLALTACNTTQKSRRACEDDVIAMKVGIFEAEAFLDALRPRIQEGYLALDRCVDRAEPCEAEDWLAFGQMLREDHREANAAFEISVNQFNPDACVAHIQNYKIEPPRRQTYQGYYYTFDETGEQIDYLINEFGRRVR